MVIGTKSQPRLCIVTGPLGKSPQFVMELLEILGSLSPDVFLITHNFPEQKAPYPHIHVRNLKNDAKKQHILIRLFKEALWRMRISVDLVKIHRRYDIVVFYLGSRSYLLATVMSKIMGKRIVSIVTGSGSRSIKEVYARTFFGHGGKLFSRVYALLEEANCALADSIVVESPGIVTFVGLQKYSAKIRLSGIFFDTSLFRPLSDMSERRNLIGYVGRIAAEKGIANFIDAIPLVLASRGDAEFFVGGDGVLLNEMKHHVQSRGLCDKVSFGGWIAHDDLPRYYSSLKLLIVPSYTESVPIVAIEAMACGTIVLATPVGGVRDVIIDGKNGFILEDNSPPLIADAVVRILNDSSHAEVSARARASIEVGYTYESARQKYRGIFEELARG